MGMPMLRTKTLLLAPPLLLALAACSGPSTPESPPAVPTVSLVANPASVASNASSMLTWSSTNATSCSAAGAWSGAKAISGNQSTGTLTTSSSYSLTCTGSGGSASASATVTVSGTPPPPPVPTVSLAANPTSVVSGGSSTLTWSSTNAVSCLASGAWSGSQATSGSQSTGALTSTSTFSLACTGPGGTASASATVMVPTGVRNYTTNFDLTENPISEGGVWHHTGNVWTNVSTANGIAFGTNGAANTYDDSYALFPGSAPTSKHKRLSFDRLTSCSILRTRSNCCCECPTVPAPHKVMSAISVISAGYKSSGGTVHSATLRYCRQVVPVLSEEILSPTM